MKRQDKTWPEYRQRPSQWVVPEEALSVIKEESLRVPHLLEVWLQAPRVKLPLRAIAQIMGSEVAVSLVWDALCYRQA